MFAILIGKYTKKSLELSIYGLKNYKKCKTAVLL